MLIIHCVAYLTVLSVLIYVQYNSYMYYFYVLAQANVRNILDIFIKNNLQQILLFQ